MRRFVLLVCLWAALGALSATAGIAAVNSVQQATGQLAVQPLSEGDVQQAIDAAATPGDEQVDLPALPGLPAPTTSSALAVNAPSSVGVGSEGSRTDAAVSDQTWSGESDLQQSDDEAVGSPANTPKPSTPTRSKSPEPTRTPDPAEASSTESEPTPSESTSEESRSSREPSSRETRTKPTHTRSMEPKGDEPKDVEHTPTPTTIPAP